MIISIDLKPLSEDTVAKMGFNNHDLWFVKIGSVVFGPFETESLKHYVLDNEHLFDSAEAQRADETEWKAFWAHTKFQRRKPQMVQSIFHQGSFWIMDQGLKTGPYGQEEISKKLEIGVLSITDHISTDDGHTWIKVFEVDAFDRRSHNPDDLPEVPIESSFHRAKLELLEKLKEPQRDHLDQVADLARSAKVIKLKREESSYPTKHDDTSYVMKWAFPVAGALVLAFVGSGLLLIPEDASREVAEVAPQEKPFYQKKAPVVPKPVAMAPAPRIAPQAQIAPPRPVVPEPREVIRPLPERAPASVRPERPMPTNRRAVRRAVSRYPTQVESHDEYRDPRDLDIERDPRDIPPIDSERGMEEHSLVDPRQAQPEAPSIDAVMNGSDPYGDPEAGRAIVEEASDF